MTSQGRRAAIGLCAIAAATTAGCAASPRYPIDAGQPMGDGGMHMTQRPQYPVDAAGAAQPSAGASASTPAPPSPPPPPLEEDDVPHAPTASGSVDSSDLPPPPPAAPGQARLDDASGEARMSGFQSAAYVVPSSSPMLFADGEASPLFEQAAYRHRRHHAAATADTAQTTAATTDTSVAEPKHTARWLRRHPREAARIAAEEKAAGKTRGTGEASASETASSAEPKPSRAWLRRHPREAARIAAAETASAKSAGSQVEAPAASETASSAEPQHSRAWLRRHPREAARLAAAEKAAAQTAATSEASAPTQTASAAVPQHSRAWLRRHPREAARIAAAEKAATESATTSGEATTPTQTASEAPQHSRAWLRRHPREAAKLAKAEEAGSSPAVAESRPHGFSYVIQKGDTLYAVSHRFNLDPAEVAKLNRLHGIGLQPGQTFELPQMAKDLGTRQHAVGVAHAEPAPVRLAETPRRRPREAHTLAPEMRPTETASTAGSPADARTAPSETGSTQASPSPAASVQTAQTSPSDAAATALAAHEATTRADRAATRRAEREARLETETLNRQARADAALAHRQARHAQAVESAAVSAPYVVHPYTALAAGSGATGISSLPAGAPPSPQRSMETNPTDDASGARPAASTYASTQTPASSPPPVVAAPTYAAPAPAPSSSLTASAAASNLAPARSYGYAPPPRPAPSYAAPSPQPKPSYASTPSPAYGGFSPGQVATLNAPSYGGPTLGRVRPTAPVATGGVVSNAAIASAGQGRFVWPLRGAILQPFGDRGPGQRNDGLDISAQAGQSVHAAAGGEVVYAGSSIPGFGNLVLVKHPGGWVTAYAHLDRIEVRMRDSVSQGEEIGQAGQTGAVTQPQLHFEVRYAPDANGKARPVDPALVLPGSG